MHYIPVDKIYFMMTASKKEMCCHSAVTLSSAAKTAQESFDFKVLVFRCLLFVNYIYHMILLLFSQQFH